MKRVKEIFITIWISSLLLGACSSDNGIIDNPEINNKVELDFSNAQWHKGIISSQIEKGSNSNTSTRSKDEIGDDENPAGKLPDNIQLYICYYEAAANKLKKEALPINKVGNEFEYYYTFLQKGDDWYAVLSNKEVSGNEEAPIMQIKVRESNEIKNDNSEDLFLFISFNAAEENDTIKLPTVDKADDLYPNTDGTPNYAEYGDKLFSTDGHFFAFDGDEKTKENIKLYSIETHTIKPDLVEGKTVSMKRMTGVITIYTMVVERFDGDTSIPISGMNREDDIETMIEATNTSLQAALEKAGLDKALRVDDYFTRKKILTNFPVEYSWVNGPLIYGKRGNLYLCNRNDAAWMMEKGEYQKGDASDYIYGVCSSCDNFPFIPAGLGTGTKITSDSSLRLYMGIAKRGEPAPERLLTVDVEVTASMDISVNKSNNLFLLFTIEDMVELAKVAGRTTGTRSISDAPDLVLPSNRLIIK